MSTTFPRKYEWRCARRELNYGQLTCPCGVITVSIFMAIILSTCPIPTQPQYSNSSSYNGSYGGGGYYLVPYGVPVPGRGVDYGAYNNFCNNISNLMIAINNSNTVTNTNMNNMMGQVTNENNINNNNNITVKTYIYGPLCTFYANVIYPSPPVYSAPAYQPARYVVYVNPPPPPDEEEDGTSDELESADTDTSADDDVAAAESDEEATSATGATQPEPYIPPLASPARFPPPPAPYYPSASFYGSQLFDSRQVADGQQYNAVASNSYANNVGLALHTVQTGSYNQLGGFVNGADAPPSASAVYIAPSEGYTYSGSQTYPSDFYQDSDLVSGYDQEGSSYTQTLPLIPLDASYTNGQPYRSPPYNHGHVSYLYSPNYYNSGRSNNGNDRNVPNVASGGTSYYGAHMR